MMTPTIDNDLGVQYPNDVSFVEATARRRGEPFHRVTVWVNGKALVYKDFYQYGLSYIWAEARRKEYKEMKATGVFIKTETKNSPAI